MFIPRDGVYEPLGIVDEVELGHGRVGILHGILDPLHQLGNDVGHRLTALHEIVLAVAAGVVVAGPRAGRNALGGCGGRVLGRILQPLHHLALDGCSHRLSGGGSQAIRRLSQDILAVRVARCGGA